MNNFLSRGSAFLAILALALIPAAAQPPRAADGIQQIAIRAQAIEAFERVCALAPADAAPHFNVAFLLQRVGRHADAIPRFERALEADPSLERARHGLAISRAHLEKGPAWRA